MCRTRHALPGLLLLLGLTAGCATERVVRSGGGPPAPPLGPDGVILHMVLLERPVHDRYLNGGLWDGIDEQTVALEQKILLQDNGFRVGRLVGATPRELQALLTSERNCVECWHQILPSGKAVTRPVGRPVPEMRYQVGQEPEVVLGKAQSFLVIVPTLTADGRTRLQFTPQIEYGDAQPEYRPAPDCSGWLCDYRRPNKTYPELSWEVTLAPNEYVVIGAAPDNPRALGYQCFVHEDDESSGQRLLVIRTSRSGADLQSPLPPAPDDAAALTSPLAMQASRTTARGGLP